MKKIMLTTLAAVFILAFYSCGSTVGVGGANTGIYVESIAKSDNRFDLVPVGDRITHTIDISTPEGRVKLQGISKSDAQRLAETEAIRKYNCDRLIDPHFDFFEKGKRILRVTVDGRPGIYKTREEQHYDLKTKQEIDINVNR